MTDTGEFNIMALTMEDWQYIMELLKREVQLGEAGRSFLEELVYEVHGYSQQPTHTKMANRAIQLYRKLKKL